VFGREAVTEMSQQQPPPSIDTATLRERIGRVGVWTFALGREPASFERATAAELERLGFRALWVASSR
jgi:hypothetical protein